MKKKNILFIIIYIVYLLSSIRLIMSILKIDNSSNIIFIISIIFFNILFLLLRYILNKRKKNKKFLLILIILFTIINLLIIYSTHKLNNITNNHKNTYTSILLKLKDNKKDLKDMTLGLLKDKTSYEGYLIAKAIIKEKNLSNNKLSYYEDYTSIIMDILDKKIDAGFFPSNYLDTLSTSDNFEDISNKIEIIYTKKKSFIEKDNNIKTDKTYFTILIMGIDSIKEDINEVNSFNGDSLTLISVNLKDYNITMLTIPRDTYVPITCFKNKKENKITHASWYGEKCLIKTIEEFMDIKIDYYAKVNFQGLVKLVNLLGGIDIDVPFSFCEQNSKRLWGKNTIFVKKGYQTLNGEQTLALARHRKETSYMKSYCGEEYTGNKLNDLVRSENQQLIIYSLLDKVKSINNINTVYKFIDTLKKNISTNVSTSQILSFYNIFKSITLNNEDIKDLFTIDKLFLSGYDKYIYDDSFKKALYNYIYYEDSLKEVVNSIKVNLNIIKHVLIKEFTYSVKDPYQEEIIGKGEYHNKNIIDTLPNFIGKFKEEVDSWSNKKNFKIIYKYIETNEYKENEVIKQSYPYAYLIKNITSKELTITLAKNIIKNKKIDCTLEENLKINECLLPNFIGWNLDQFNNWYSDLKNYNINIMTPEIIKEFGDKEEIISQSKIPNTPLKDIASIKITYSTKKEEQ